MYKLAELQKCIIMFKEADKDIMHVYEGWKDVLRALQIQYLIVATCDQNRCTYNVSGPIQGFIGKLGSLLYEY